MKKGRRTVSVEQKRRFLELHDAHPSWKRGRLASEFQKEYGGDLLKSSTSSDWLKPKAIKLVRESTPAVASAGKKAEPTYRKRDALRKQ